MKYWAPPLLYMALIFAVSSLEQPPFPMPEFEWLTIDKLYHFIEYAILGGLLAWAFAKAKPSVVPSRELSVLESQSFRFGRKNRPLGKDPSVHFFLDTGSEIVV